jgi:hypothetical protein
MGVRRDNAALSSGCKSHPATAPAGNARYLPTTPQVDRMVMHRHGWSYLLTILRQKPPVGRPGLTGLDFHRRNLGGLSNEEITPREGLQPSIIAEQGQLTVTMEQGQDNRAKAATATGACLVHSGQVAP